MHSNAHANSLPVIDTLIYSILEPAIQIENILGIERMQRDPKARRSVSNLCQGEPLVGYQIMSFLINNRIDTHAIYSTTGIVCVDEAVDVALRMALDDPLNAAVHENPGFQANLLNLFKNSTGEFNIAVCDQLVNLWINSSATLESFLGKTMDDRFRIFFVREARDMVYIEKSIDYRVHEWNKQNPRYFTRNKS